jgi:hypothetical protein
MRALRRIIFVIVGIAYSTEWCIVEPRGGYLSLLWGREHFHLDTAYNINIVHSNVSFN